METRIRYEAEAQIAALGARPRAAYVLAGEDWHAGVIGIVASRLAERHRRPVVLIALDGDIGKGSGAQHRRVRPARGSHRLRRAPAPLRRPPRRGRPGDRARARRGVRRRRSARTPSECSRPRTRPPWSGSTPSWAARSWAWSSRRSCTRWRRSGAATRACRCWSPTPRSATCARWGKASTCASRSSRGSGARARGVAFGTGRAPAGRGGRAGRSDLHAGGQRVERRHRAPAGAAPGAARRAGVAGTRGEPAIEPLAVRDLRPAEPPVAAAQEHAHEELTLFAAPDRRARSCVRFARGACTASIWVVRPLPLEAWRSQRIHPTARLSLSSTSFRRAR